MNYYCPYESKLRGGIRKKDLDKLGIFLVGLGVFGQTVLEWLRFFRFKPGRERDPDFDWDEMISI